MDKRLLVAIVILLSGCTSQMLNTKHIDELAFRYLGGTIFAKPDITTMKEVHLDNGSLLGQPVIVEGAVAETSEYFTYVVLSDSTARMMVVLTEIDSAKPRFEKQKPKILKVLGVVENGRKGHPFIQAKAINVVKDPSS